MNGRHESGNCRTLNPFNRFEHKFRGSHRCSSISSTSIVVTYLLLSTRWAYIRNLCYGMADGWIEFTLYIGVPLLMILQTEIPDFLELVFKIYIGAN